jgi:glucose-6-phosphate 1-epimerase
MEALPTSNRIERITGKGGLPWLRLTHTSGFTLVISEYGAQVLSWATPSGEELLFVSEAASFNKGTPIRGGIPIVFPQFGRGELAHHGFARICDWKVIREQVSTNGSVSVTLRLVSDPALRALWPHGFAVEVEIVLTEVLLITLTVHNTGGSEFRFTSALHTYLRTSDVTKVELHGFDGVEYVDFLDNRKTALETREIVLIHEPIDRAYRDSPHAVTVFSRGDNRSYSIIKEGFCDTVVWNPGASAALAISDLLPSECAQMVCVESGNVLSPVVLGPGETHTSAQILRVQN